MSKTLKKLLVLVLVLSISVIPTLSVFATESVGALTDSEETIAENEVALADEPAEDEPLSEKSAEESAEEPLSEESADEPLSEESAEEPIEEEPEAELFEKEEAFDEVTLYEFAEDDVAAIGETGYATLLEAINAANSASTIQTITLLKTITYDPLASLNMQKSPVIGESTKWDTTWKFILDGNGHTLTFDGDVTGALYGKSKDATTSKPSAKIYLNSSNVTFKNITLDLNNKFGLRVGGGSSLTIGDGESTTIVKNGRGTNGSIAQAEGANAKVTIKAGAEIKHTQQSGGPQYAFFINSSATLNLEGGSIESTGKAVHIQAHSCQLNLSGNPSVKGNVADIGIHQDKDATKVVTINVADGFQGDISFKYTSSGILPLNEAIGTITGDAGGTLRAEDYAGVTAANDGEGNLIWVVDKSQYVCYTDADDITTYKKSFPKTNSGFTSGETIFVLKDTVWEVTGSYAHNHQGKNFTIEGLKKEDGTYPTLTLNMHDIEGPGTQPTNLAFYNASVMKLKNVTIDLANTYNFALSKTTNPGATINFLDGAKLINGPSGSAITINDGTYVNIGTEDGDNSGIEFSDFPGGLFSVPSGGTLNMYGGTINGCNSTTHRVVYLSGTFNMYGGTIQNNTSTANGGIMEVTSTGVFNMTGGAVKNNTSTGANGGGAIFNSGTINITGGEFSGNTAKEGGAIYHNGAAFTLGGDVVIENNTATSGGGVFLNGSRNVRVSGSAKVYNNTKTGTTTPSNVSGWTDAKIIVSDASFSGKIGVTGNASNFKITNFALLDEGVSMTAGEINPGFFFNDERTNDLLYLKEDGTFVLVYDGECYVGDDIYTRYSLASQWSNGTSDNIKVIHLLKNAELPAATGIPFFFKLIGEGESAPTVKFTTPDLTTQRVLCSTSNNGTTFGSIVLSNVTLDLNGKWLNICNQTNVTFEEKVTVKNGWARFDDATLYKNSNGANGVIQVNNNSTLTMGKDCLITGCNSEKVGGVFVNGGAFYMQGGAITGNHAAQRSAGVYLNSDTSVFEISGDASVYGNTAGDNNEEKNVSSWTATARVTVAGPLTGKIGVSDYDSFKISAFGKAKEGYTITDNDLSCFFADADTTEDKTGYIIYWHEEDVFGFYRDGECYIGTNENDKMSISEAIEAANGEVITLVKDAAYTIDEASLVKNGNLWVLETTWNFTLDGDGHTLSIVTPKHAKSRINLLKSTVILKDATIDLKNETAFRIGENSALTLESGAIIKNGLGENGGAMIIEHANAVVTMKPGSKIINCSNTSGAAGAIRVQVGKLYLEGGEISNNVTISGGAINVYTNGTVYIKGNTVVSNNRLNGTIGVDGIATGGTEENIYISRNDAASAYGKVIINGEFTGDISLLHEGATEDIGISHDTVTLDGGSIGAGGSIVSERYPMLSMAAEEGLLKWQADLSSFVGYTDNTTIKGYYVDLRAALASLENGEIFHLMKNTTLEIGANEHNFAGLNFTLDGSNEGETPYKVSIHFNETAETHKELRFYSNSDVTFTNVIIDLAGGYGLVLTQANELGGTLTLENGASIINAERDAIVVNKNSLLNIKDGALIKMSEEEGISARGIRIADGGSANMTGGKIEGFKADNGAGVNVVSGATFTMEGGSIKGNTATVNGGGVMVNGGTFNFFGGTIEGNKAPNGGGIWVQEGGSIHLKGNATALTNFSSDGITLNNLGIWDHKEDVTTTVTLKGDLTGKIGISCYNKGTDTYYPGYVIGTADGEFTGAENIFATANNEAVAKIADGKLVFRMKPISLTYGDGLTIKDGETAVQSPFDRGTALTISAEGTPLFWIDEATGKILGNGETLSLSAVLNGRVKPIMPTAGMYNVAFLSAHNQLAAYEDVAEGAAPTKVPSSLKAYATGYTLNGWTVNGEGDVITSNDIYTATLTENTKYVADYEKDESLKAKLTVNGGTFKVNGADGINGNEYTYNDVVVVTAANTDTFKAWLRDGVIVSLDSEYTFYMDSSDVNLKVSEEAATGNGIISMFKKESVKNILGENYNIVEFTTSRDVKYGYAVLEAGVIYVRNTEATETDLTVENVGNKVGDALIKAGRAQNKTDNQYKLTANYDENGIAARGFLVYKDSHGTIWTVYTDIITTTATAE